MNERERYLETLLFGRPDKIPFQPGGPRESTLKAWRSQGLPEGVSHMAALREALGIAPPPAEPAPPPLGVSFEMIPRFEEKILERRDGHLIVQDWKGNVCEIDERFDPSYLRHARDFVTRRWIKLPVENRADWEAMKQRYDPRDPARFPEDFDARCAAWRKRGAVLSVHFNGPFWQLREWVGAEALCMLFLDDPDFVREMIAFWTEFASAALAQILRRTDIDVLALSEDMAYKRKSFISPAMARAFLLPSYRRWIEEARAGGARVFDMDSDGYIGDLIPVFLDAGFNCCNPIEVAAGSDVVEFRRRFGRRMAYRGGIDKRLIARGGTAIQDELKRIMPAMRDGGYIPSCDHGVPPDISWPNFVEYARGLARWTGWL